MYEHAVAQKTCSAIEKQNTACTNLTVSLVCGKFSKVWQQHKCYQSKKLLSVK